MVVRAIPERLLHGDKQACPVRGAAVEWGWRQTRPFTSATLSSAVWLFPSGRQRCWGRTWDRRRGCGGGLNNLTRGRVLRRGSILALASVVGRVRRGLRGVGEPRKNSSKGEKTFKETRMYSFRFGYDLCKKSAAGG